MYMYLQVVVKFIRKAKVLKDCWIDDEEMGRVPLEVSLLARLHHTNIVKVNKQWLQQQPRSKPPMYVLLQPLLVQQCCVRVRNLDCSEEAGTQFLITR